MFELTESSRRPFVHRSGCNKCLDHCCQVRYGKYYEPGFASARDDQPPLDAAGLSWTRRRGSLMSTDETSDSERTDVNSIPSVTPVPDGFLFMKLEFNPKLPTSVSQDSPLIQAIAHHRRRRLACSTMCTGRPGHH